MNLLTLCIVLMLSISKEGVSVSTRHLGKRMATAFASSAFFVSGSISNPDVPAAYARGAAYKVDSSYDNSDTTFQEQLKVLETLQKKEQAIVVQKASRGLADEELDLINGDIITKGVVILEARNSDTLRLNPADYPQGLPRASSLNGDFDNKNAALIISVVGRDGPPVAAQKFPLANLKFPFEFVVTTDDLMFPYNKDVWLRSPLSKDSVAITAVLDTDGILSTPNAGDMFGFSIADPVRAKKGDKGDKGETSIMVGPPGAGTEKLERNPVNVPVNLKSDGKAYNEADFNLLARVDSELARLAAARSEPTATSLQQPSSGARPP